MKKTEVRKKRFLDQDRTLEISPRTFSFTLRSIIICVLIAITVGYFAGVYLHIASGQNPSVGDLSTICMVDPDYEGMQCMDITGVRGNSDNNLVTALFTGHWKSSFFALGARIQ